MALRKGKYYMPTRRPNLSGLSGLTQGISSGLGMGLQLLEQNKQREQSQKWLDYQKALMAQSQQRQADEFDWRKAKAKEDRAWQAKVYEDAIKRQEEEKSDKLYQSLEKKFDPTLMEFEDIELQKARLGLERAQAEKKAGFPSITGIRRGRGGGGGVGGLASGKNLEKELLKDQQYKFLKTQQDNAKEVYRKDPSKTNYDFKVAADVAVRDYAIDFMSGKRGKTPGSDDPEKMTLSQEFTALKNQGRSLEEIKDFKNQMISKLPITMQPQAEIEFFNWMSQNFSDKNITDSKKVQKYQDEAAENLDQEKVDLFWRTLGENVNPLNTLEAPMRMIGKPIENAIKKYGPTILSLPYNERFR